MKIFTIVLIVLMSIGSAYAQVGAAEAIAIMKALYKANAKNKKENERAQNEINMTFAYWEKYQEDYAKANKKKAGDCKQINFPLPGAEMPVNYGNSDSYSYECGLEDGYGFVKATSKKKFGDCPAKSVFKVTYDAKTSTTTDVSPTKVGCKNEMPFFKSTKTPDNMLRDNRDMQTYRTVKIGNLVWMAEDLNYAHKKSTVSHNGQARMYNWEIAKEACPEGWRLPSARDFYDLIVTAGGIKIAGINLKSKKGWEKNDNGTDNYGFAALPNFFPLGANWSAWWSSDLSSKSSKKDRAITLLIKKTNAVIDNFPNGNLFPVRCVKR